MIPVLVVPILNRPDLLDSMLLSVDEEVGELIIIDNSLAGLDIGTYTFPRLSARHVVLHHNIGVSAAWNLAIKLTPNAPWWCFVNNDIVFAAGDLGRLVAHMDAAGGMGMLRTPSAFGITRDVVDRVGWFDENFVPAYFEDNDYVRRCGLVGVTVTALPAAYMHETSSTLRSDPQAQVFNGRSFPANQVYYHEKWGGPPGGEVFNTPFNRDGSPRDWILPFDRLRSLTWGLE